MARSFRVSHGFIAVRHAAERHGRSDLMPPVPAASNQAPISSNLVQAPVHHRSPTCVLITSQQCRRPHLSCFRGHFIHRLSQADGTGWATESACEPRGSGGREARRCSGPAACSQTAILSCVLPRDTGEDRGLSQGANYVYENSTAGDPRFTWRELQTYRWGNTTVQAVAVARSVLSCPLPSLVGLGVLRGCFPTRWDEGHHFRSCQILRALFIGSADASRRKCLL